LRFNDIRRSAPCRILEGQFHLPPQSIGFQNLLSIGFGVVEGGENQDVFGIFAGLWSNGFACLLFQAQSPLRLCNRLLAFANGADSSCDALLAAVDPDRPSGQVAGLAQ
jgi:hypothetical protein